MNAIATVSRLPYRAPWSWRQFHDHFSLRALPGVEVITADTYRRSFRLAGVTGWFSVSPEVDRHALLLRCSASAATCLPILEQRVVRMFDLQTDPQGIASHFAGDPHLAARVARNPGLRLPTAFDPFEQAVRAIIGQQVSVKAAVTIASRLVQRLGQALPQAQAQAQAGGLERLFPSAQDIASADLQGIGMPGKRVHTLQHFAEQVASGALRLDIDDSVEALIERLCALPGIGPWTAQYIALRGFGSPDAFPLSDLGLLKAPLWGPGGIDPKRLQAHAQGWRPWRAYAAVHIWHSATAP